jgi:hypothetical protein
MQKKGGEESQELRGLCWQKSNPGKSHGEILLMLAQCIVLLASAGSQSQNSWTWHP